MNKKLVKEFLLITFVIMILAWGSASYISQTKDILLTKNIYLKVLFILGGFSPTIASYISLKINNKETSFKKWIKEVFAIKFSFKTYGLIVLFLIIYFGIGCLLNNFKYGVPLYMQLLIAVFILFAGGIEEAGWRMLLQSELEKKYNFNVATLITGVIWWLWHYPILFINGNPNKDLNFFVSGILCIALSYALAAVRKQSNGVFPCIVLHTLINSLTASYVFTFSISSILLILTVNIILANIIVYYNKLGGVIWIKS